MSMAEYSKTFCPYPWIHVMTHPTSTVNFCCVATGQVKRDNDDKHPIMLDRGDKIEDVWNGKNYRKIRRQMIEGEQVEGCEPCYQLEDLGIPSYRENDIKDWMGFHRKAPEIKQIIEKSIKNDYFVEEAPQYLDFRLGTLCNLKCRMCQSQNSSAIYKELKDDTIYTEEERAFVMENTHWNQLEDYTLPWFDEPDFLATVEEWLPNVNRLYFT